jgi:hypothetical protein
MGGARGAANPNWRGGRTIASTGYALVRVGVGHPLADVRGYAYEHRLVASEKLGRDLLPGEVVHHIDGNKLNNDPVNLEVLAGHAEHRVEHRSERSRDRLRKPNEPNPLVRCACGCGTELERYDASNRPRRFVTGHNPPPSKPTMDAVLTALDGVALTRAEIATFTQRPRTVVSTCLAKLQRAGLARKIGGRRWEIVRRDHG